MAEKEQPPRGEPRVRVLGVVLQESAFTAFSRRALAVHQRQRHRPFCVHELPPAMYPEFTDFRVLSGGSKLLTYARGRALIGLRVTPPLPKDIDDPWIAWHGHVVRAKELGRQIGPIHDTSQPLDVADMLHTVPNRVAELQKHLLDHPFELIAWLDHAVLVSSHIPQWLSGFDWRGWNDYREQEPESAVDSGLHLTVPMWNKWRQGGRKIYDCRSGVAPVLVPLSNVAVSEINGLFVETNAVTLIGAGTCLSADDQRARNAAVEQMVDTHRTDDLRTLAKRYVALAETYAPRAVDPALYVLRYEGLAHYRGWLWESQWMRHPEDQGPLDQSIECVRYAIAAIARANSELRIVPRKVFGPYMTLIIDPPHVANVS